MGANSVAIVAVLVATCATGVAVYLAAILEQCQAANAGLAEKLRDAYATMRHMSQQLEGVERGAKEAFRFFEAQGESRIDGIETELFTYRNSGRVG